MQAIILAAGESTRTHPLTINKPKPMLKIANKRIIEHTFEQIKDLVDEAIIIVGFKKEMIQEFLGEEFLGIPITYVEQKERLGTGHAILQAKNLIKGKTLILPGDDFFMNEDLKELSKNDYGVLVKEVDNPKAFGIMDVDDKGRTIGIIEKPQNPTSNLANTACWVLEKDFLKHLEKIKPSSRGEIEATDIIKMLAIEGKNIELVKSKHWMPIGYPWHLINANEYLTKLMFENVKKNKISKDSVIEDNVTIIGEIIVGKNTIIKAGTYIEGPVIIGDDCVIGPQAHLRPFTTIGDECRIGKTELFDVIVGDKTTSKHTAYLAHGVVGDNVNIGAGTITADYRHDGKSHITIIKENKVDTHRRKLGAFIGDDVNTGIGTLIYPGRKIWPNLSTYPGEILKKDLMVCQLKSNKIIEFRTDREENE